MYVDHIIPAYTFNITSTWCGLRFILLMYTDWLNKILDTPNLTFKEKVYSTQTFFEPR